MLIKTVGKEAIKLRGFVPEKSYFLSEEKCKFFQKRVMGTKKGKIGQHCKSEMLLFGTMTWHFQETLRKEVVRVCV